MIMRRISHFLRKKSRRNESVGREREEGKEGRREGGREEGASERRGGRDQKQGEANIWQMYIFFRKVTYDLE